MPPRYREWAAACVLVALSAVPPGSAGSPLSSGIDLDGLDPAVRPQDDFFHHVNGRWLATTEIPADKASWGTVDLLRLQATQHLRTILESPAPAGDAEAEAIRAFYASFMDAQRIEALGVKPMQAELAHIDAIDGPEALARYVGSTRLSGASGPIGLSTSIDRGNSTAYAVYAWQGGLGMPDRDYYLREDARFIAMRAEYLAYLETLFTLAGFAGAAERAGGVLELEHALAGAQWTRVANRDPTATYNVMDTEAARKLAPGFAWEQMLQAAGLRPGTRFVLAQPDYATALARLVQDRPLAQWKDYFRARLLDDYAPYLSSAFVEAWFDFRHRALSGTPQLRPRWQRAVDAVNGGMGFAIGREYVARHFPPGARLRMEALAGNLVAAMDARIETLEWMTAATRAEARDKLRRVRVKIGYPDRWRSYPGLEIRRDDLVGNVMRAGAFEWRRQVERLDGPVDPAEWLMTPQTVNAYYLPTANEIVFPAAILQPPLFNVGAEEAANYGAIGAVIGHEISHGFDDKGRQYDGEGNLRDWWAAADDRAFRDRTRLLVAQYGAYRPVPDMAVDGELTLGENIGDLSGLAIAWQAWQRSLGGREAPVLDGLSGARRFFYGYGQLWRTRHREESLRQRVLSDPHAPAEYRANGVVTHFGPFYQTFDLEEGDGLWRPEGERVSIW